MNDELCLEDDGDIGMDWATPERDMLTMSLRSNGVLMWAVLLADGRKAHGVAQLVPEAHEVLAKLVTPNAALTGGEAVRVEGTVMQRED